MATDQSSDYAPFSAEKELAAYSASTAASGAITPAIAEHCEGGVALTFAVTEGDGTPIPGVGTAIRILPTGRVRFIIRRSANTRALMALMQDGRIATTCSRPISHRSVQIKGADAVAGAVTEADLRAATKQARGFRDSLIELGYEAHLVDNFCTWDARDLVAVEFTPSALFSQTPGPKAGSELTR